MEFLIALWLPILITSIVLFFASFICWMILPHHFGDMNQLPNEDEFMKTIAEMNLPSGNYMFPYAGTKQEMGSAEYQEKYAAGPRGLLDIYSVPNMGMNMVHTVLFFLVTTTCIAYISFVACAPGSDGLDFMKVFRIAGTIGILVHAPSGYLNAIWWKKRMIMHVIDGIAYGLLIGLIFAAMWPYEAI